MSEQISPSGHGSVFATRSLDDVYEEIRTTYLANQYPWVIGYSGGKDSTVVLQLVWYALAALPASKRTKQVYVLSSDTLVETPVIVDYIDTSLRLINESAKRERLPFEAHKVTPRTTDTFWVNLIGRGYPAPYSSFRWCTDRMKIQPTSRFILDCVARYGEVILALGARRAESARRAQTMNHRDITGKHLTRHKDLYGAYVYTPIEDWTVDDVWQYLLQVPSPWGIDNNDLAALYQSAQSGECPLVIDKSSPSCGSSRFGCWTCTVVTKDKAIENMIDSGAEWMLPLLQYRDYLASTQDPEMKPRIRELKRRNGRIQEHEGKFIWGPYKFEFRKELLEKLLRAEVEVQRNGPDSKMRLITDDELLEIRRIWRTEIPDWEDSVPKIYAKVTGDRLAGINDDWGPFTGREKEVLTRLATENGVQPELVLRLVELERQMYGMLRRSAIQKKIDDYLSEDWRSKEEAIDALPALQRAMRRPTKGEDGES